MSNVTTISGTLGKSRWLLGAISRSVSGLKSFTLVLVYLFSSMAIAGGVKKWIVVPKKDPTPAYLSGTLAVSYRALQTQTTRSLLTAEAPGLRVIKSFRALDVHVVESDVEQLERLKSQGILEGFEPDIEYRPANLNGISTPSGLTLSPWLDDIMGFSEFEPDAELTSSATPTLVAVIDTGATVAHPYLAPALAVNSVELSGTSGVDDDNNGYIDDIYGGNSIYKNGDVAEIGTDHGSHVAGLVKAVRDQAIQNYSQARNVKILPIRFIDASGAGSTSGALDAIDYAIRRGSKVINASWGAGGLASFSQALYDSMVQAYQTYDILFTVAAGNAEGFVANNNDANPYFPASFRIPGQITVSSITPVYSFTGVGTAIALTRVGFSDFSNYGANSVQIAAPGSYRNAYFEEYGVYSANAAYTSNSNLFIRKKGTSMAAPVVAGVAGVIRAINPSLTAYETRRVILETAIASDAASGKVSTGSVVNAQAAFVRAGSEYTTGEAPAASGAPYEVYSDSSASNAGSKASSGGSSSSGGGCGLASTVQDVSSNSGDPSGPEGPLGGNSLFLFSALYAVFLALRRLRVKTH